MKKTKLQKAIDVLCKALEEDPGYFNAWRANIAMEFYDNMTDRGYISKVAMHNAANAAAVNFLEKLIKSRGTKK